MIAYEELEKALARWKARRPEAMGAGVPVDDNEATSMGVSGPAAMDPNEVTSMGEDVGIPSGISAADEPASDSTGELEIGDAIPDEN